VPAAPPGLSGAFACAEVTTVTDNVAERALSSTEPSFTNDANCSACEPAESAGNLVLQANPALVSELAHETPASSDLAPST
jgi:hypothetical protein